jgi:hypothetical protein
VETLIWLTEVAPKSKVGKRLLEYPPRFRLRARAAHHAQIDRQQRGDRCHLGQMAGGSRTVAREAELSIENELAGMGNPKGVDHG